MTVTVRSFAKINIGLRIGPSREDGFHELLTVYQTIGLHDVIRVSMQRGSGIEIRCEDPRVPRDESNTCYQIVERGMAALRAKGRIVIEIEKRLPVQGGLGGASANAVATLLALELAVRKTLTQAEKLRIAAEVGSDLPLFLVGGAVLGVGRGEQVFPLADFPATACVVVTPEIGVSTPKAFAEWDRKQGLKPPSIDGPDAALKGRSSTDVPDAALKGRSSTDVPDAALKGRSSTDVPDATLKGRSSTDAPDAALKRRSSTDARDAAPSTSSGRALEGRSSTDASDAALKRRSSTVLSAASMNSENHKLTVNGGFDRISELGYGLSAWLSGLYPNAPSNVVRRRGRAGNPLLGLVRAGIENDFERVVFPEYPELGEAKRALVRSGAKYASLSGSGSTLYGIFESRQAARLAVARLRKGGWAAQATVTLPRAVYWRRVFVG